MELAHALMAGGHDWYSRYWDTSQRRGKRVKKNNRRLDKTFIDFLTLFHWFGWRTNYGVVVAQA